MSISSFARSIWRSYLHAKSDHPEIDRDRCRLGSLDQYEAAKTALEPDCRVEELLRAQNPNGEFSFDGFCWVDQRRVKFHVDYLYSGDEAVGRMPNWRERLVCPMCSLNNRQRAALHIATLEAKLTKSSAIYAMEQVTPFFAALCKRHAGAVGSEYLGDGIQPGTIDHRGIRHENASQLSFSADSFDAVLSFDVFEHVPNFERAFRECHRVLRSGGTLVFTAPFLQDQQQTRIRAAVIDGQIHHRLSPIYHGDPVNPCAGILCFQEFGWDVLGLLRSAGFRSAHVITYHSKYFGYLGGPQFLFIAQK